MKVFIPSYKRPQEIKTHLALGDAFDWKVIVHDPLQMHYYKKTIPENKIICSYAKYGISSQRNFIKNNLVGSKEWFIMMDDNINYFEAVIEEEYNNENLKIKYPDAWIKNDAKFNNRVYRQKVNPDRLIKIFDELKNKCINIGVGFAGFSANKNYFFSRENKWKYFSLICSKACIVFNDELRWDEGIKTMDDYDYSCQAMLKYGKTVVNNYVWPNAGHNQKGGLGKIEERGKYKINDCKVLMKKYPNLFRYKNRKNSLPEAEIVMRGHTKQFIEKWRKENGL